MKVSDGVRGALAGAVGGIVGGAVKLACEALVPPREPGREAPPGILADDVVRWAGSRGLAGDEKERAANTIHWMFSVVSGAMFGVAVEARPSLSKSEGVTLGLAIWVGFHELFLPLTNATPSLVKLPLSEQLNECVTHCAYGFAVERTRRAFRPLLDPL